LCDKQDARGGGDDDDDDDDDDDLWPFCLRCFCPVKT